MNGLRQFLILAARTFDFLAKQDDSTLEAYASGTRELTFVPTGSASADREPFEGVRNDPPPRNPYQAAQALQTQTSQQERQTYLTTTGFSVKELREVAKLCGLSRYSKLTRTELVELLIRGVAVSPGDPVESESEGERPVTAQESRSSAPTPPRGMSGLEHDTAVIATRLRDTDTEDEGAAYLDSQHLDREGLLAVAAELQLTRLDRLTQKELRRRVLKQAIGARRKFAGLRKW